MSVAHTLRQVATTIAPWYGRALLGVLGSGLTLWMFTPFWMHLLGPRARRTPYTWREYGLYVLGYVVAIFLSGLFGGVVTVGFLLAAVTLYLDRRIGLKEIPYWLAAGMALSALYMFVLTLITRIPTGLPLQWVPWLLATLVVFLGLALAALGFSYGMAIMAGKASAGAEG